MLIIVNRVFGCLDFEFLIPNFDYTQRCTEGPQKDTGSLNLSLPYYGKSKVCNNFGTLRDPRACSNE